MWILIGIYTIENDLKSKGVFEQNVNIFKNLF